MMDFAARGPWPQRDGLGLVAAIDPRVRVALQRLALLGGAALMLASNGGQREAARERTTPGHAAQVERFTPSAPTLLDGDAARTANARLAFAATPRPAAAAFRFRGDDESRTNALQCLAAAIYYEAGAEAEDGRRAVAQVVLNRVRHPAYPASVCGVVFEGAQLSTGCQFSFTCDGSLARRPDAAGWRSAVALAAEALDGRVVGEVGYSTHYHADYVLPYWAFRLDKTARLGAHIFYRWPGGWGGPAAFRKAYAGRETAMATLMALSAAVGGWPEARGPALHPFTIVRDGAVERLVAEAAAAGGVAAPDPLAPAPAAASPVTAREAARVRERAEAEANRAADSFSAYSGLAFAEQRLSLLVLEGEGCAVRSRLGGRAIWHEDGRDADAADRLVASGVLDGLLAVGRDGRIASGAPSPLAREVARAVFARATALREGEARGRAMVERQRRAGHGLVPLLAERLRGFERQRTRYQTLASFLPVLLRGLDRGAAPAGDERCAADPRLDEQAAVAMS